MHPALSVIFFTVTAGAGYGLLFLLAFVHLANLSEQISPDQVTFMGIVGLALVTAGLISSTFHLIWLGLEFFTGNSTATAVFALIMASMALIVLVCTAMIYASLKTIRQWHTPLTPVNYVLLGVVLGALILAAMFAQQGLDVGRLLGLSGVMLVAAALVKLAYFFWIGQPAGPTINTALGFTRATVKLLDVGHSSDTFHTQEFGYQVDRVKLIWLRVISMVLAFVLPILLVTGLIGSGGFAMLLLAAVSAYAGIFLERWLFFAEARHVVNLYHGAQRT